MAAILNAVGDCPAREKAVSEEMKAHEKASQIVRSALPQERRRAMVNPARARSGAFSLGRRWTRWGLCERRRAANCGHLLDSLGGGSCIEKTDYRQRALLRARRERQRRRTAEQSDEFAPPHGPYPKAKDHKL